MKILMLGWEFPPFFAGGIGVVCNELTKELIKNNDVEITYVMPFGPKEITDKHIRILVADNIIPSDKIKIRRIPTIVTPYMNTYEYDDCIKGLRRDKDGNVKLMHDNTKQLYGKDLISEVYNFAEKLRLILEEEDFDIIHAHDWMTIPAGVVAKEVTGKPLIIHVHNTIYDRYLGNGGEHEKEIELNGLLKADRIIAISNFVKNILVDKYGINSNKIEVIHHARIEGDPCPEYKEPKFKEKDKVVLYAGRVTLQKGPEYFIEAAKKVSEFVSNVKFIMIGSGDQLQRMIDRVAQLGLSDKFMFHGFYNRKEATMFFKMADVFVMPSVSEPFGVVPFEAMTNETPSIISKQSGCSEILKNALKVDFWDVDQIANNIVALLNHQVLHNSMKNEGLKEINGLNWDGPAKRCIDVYKKVLIGRT
ncbi:MAG: glycosyltransferase family 4 protein [Candidatus Pacearchaeota archaeon]|nr:glycosyltransferase family 4 protein [Candidatus Pacearchaeota archaeon]